MSDEFHAASRQHLSNLDYYNVPVVDFQKSWTCGWCLGPEAPVTLTLQQTREEYQIDDL